MSQFRTPPSNSDRHQRGLMLSGRIQDDAKVLLERRAQANSHSPKCQTERAYIPAGAKIRKWHEPHRRKPPATYRTHIAPAAFFFEGVPQARGQHDAQTDAPSPQYVSDYLATPDGLDLTKAFMQIPDPKPRRSIVNLVEQIAGH